MSNIPTLTLKTSLALGAVSHMLNITKLGTDTTAMAAHPLREQIHAAMRAGRYSHLTEKAYVLWIRRFILFNGTRHPAELGQAHVGAFLSNLAVSRKVASATQMQALNALLFLYRKVLGIDLPWLDNVIKAKKPARLPVVLSETEVQACSASCAVFIG